MCATAPQLDAAAAERTDDGEASFEALGRRVTRILTAAEEEATAIRDAARREVMGARQELRRLDEETTERRQELLRGAEQDASRISRTAHERAETVLEEARREAAQLVATAREERDRVCRERDAIKARLAELQERLTALMNSG